jgi:hypothetical protein
MTWVYMLSLWTIVAVAVSLLLGRTIGVCSEDRRRVLVKPALTDPEPRRRRVAHE